MKKGDKVSVLNEDLRGTVLSVHGTDIYIEDEFGFTHTFKKHELVMADASLYAASQVKPKPETPIKTSKKQAKPALILDLHYDKLENVPHRADSFERLLIQKQKLQETLDFCRQNRIRRLQIIHGIGDGTLQNMVVEFLESQANLDYHHQAVIKDQSGSILVEMA